MKKLLLALAAVLFAFPAYATSSDLYVSTSGYVGVNNTAPPDQFDVSGALGITATTAATPLNGLYSPSANELALTTSGATALTITATGSIGIGTTTPGDPLTVYGYTASYGVSVFPNLSANGWSELDVVTSSGSQGYFGYYAPNNAVVIDTRSSSVPLELGVNDGTSIYIEPSNGNVGIGTTTPSQTLEVNGEVQIDNFASSTSTTVCQNSGVLANCSSARSYKSNIKPSELGLDEVLKMKPVTFDFKDHEDNWEKHDFGFIAEDMEEINPLFVTYDNDGQISGVRYMQLTAVNAKAIQQLHAIIEKQQSEIDELKRTVDQLAHKQ